MLEARICILRGTMLPRALIALCVLSLTNRKHQEGTTHRLQGVLTTGVIGRKNYATVGELHRLKLILPGV